MTASAPAASAFVMSPENLMPPSAISGNVGFARGLRARQDRRDLGHADAADDARRADRSRAHADLDRVGAGRDQIAGRFLGGDVSDNEFQFREPPLHFLHGFDHARRMAVRRIDRDHIHFRADQFRHAFQEIAASRRSPRRRAAGPERPWPQADT